MRLAVWAISLLCFSSFAWDHSHAAWDAWLKENVTFGQASLIDYNKVKAHPDLLNQYIKNLESVSKAAFEKVSPLEQQAFLINAYNAIAIQTVVMHYPVKSIRDIGNALHPVWKEKVVKLFGEEQSLDGIEHGWLRKVGSDPRVAFALVKAAKGSPILPLEAWVAERLETQLENAAKVFVADTTKNRYDLVNNKLYLSPVFNWHASDFAKSSGSVVEFVAKRWGVDPVEQAKMKSARIYYLDFDWALNDAK